MTRQRADVKALDTVIDELTGTVGKLMIEIERMRARNDHLEEENHALGVQVDQLNNTLCGIPSETQKKLLAEHQERIKKAIGDRATLTLRRELARQRDLLRAVLLFHAGGIPNTAQWEIVMGTREMTTKILCDRIREALGFPHAKIGSSPPEGGTADE